MTQQQNTPSPQSPSASAGAEPDRIDIHSTDAVRHWAGKLNATEMQIRDAVKAAGDRAADVELYLKGSRSSTNDDRVEEAGGHD